MIRAIIFDCFGVLYVNSGKHFYETKIPNYEEVKDELRQLSRQADYGFITQDELAAGVAELSGLKKEYVSAHLQGKHVRNEELLHFSQSLRPVVRIGLLSNISKGAMDSYFTFEERERLFDTTVLSSDVNMLKPYIEIYQLTAERIGIPVGECVMIDDSADNCEGAEIAGMYSIYYKSYHQTCQELEKLLAKTP